jgi:cysteine synthase
MARKLIKDEGILCGGSSGTVLWAALEAAKGLKSDQKCLCIFADGIRNYLGKFVQDQWMSKNNFNI